MFRKPERDRLCRIRTPAEKCNLSAPHTSFPVEGP